jgi:3-deoxy-D-manno-octulosonate 8-phosphate phosphatase KdsC-like HAD superfamily phosphatase
VDLRLTKCGGDGAVREFTDFLLAAQNKENEILKTFLESGDIETQSE